MPWRWNTFLSTEQGQPPWWIGQTEILQEEQGESSLSVKECSIMGEVRVVQFHLELSSRGRVAFAS